MRSTDHTRFLRALGERIRGERARRGMSRKLLAKHAGISERYVTQLESGKGNVSIVLLRQITDALGIPLSRLFESDESSSAILARFSPAQLAEVYASLSAMFAGDASAARPHRV